MAEGHNAVAFQFTVSDEGVGVDVNHEALKAVWSSGVRSWKKRLGRFKNGYKNFIYPMAPGTWLSTIVGCLVFRVGLKKDPSFGAIEKLAMLPVVNSLELNYRMYVSTTLFASIGFLSFILSLRYTLKALLTYTSWMFEPRGKMSIKTKIWLMSVKLLSGRNPRLYSFQGSLPKLPVPSLNDTMKRFLRAHRPVVDDDKYDTLVKQADEFVKTIGPKLQRFLKLKSFFSCNYVSDWWEEYVYLRGRSPIMVNSNFYGLDAVKMHPTEVQAARAANCVYAMLQFRRQLDREELKPILLNKTVPLCSWQYERVFNTTRVPGEETDQLVHYKDANHITVFNKGRYFRVNLYYKGKPLKPAELEIVFQEIIDDPSTPMDGERELAALTAGDRLPWTRARKDFFKRGVNKTSLDCIEKAAFMLVLDEDPQNFDKNDSSQLTKFGHAMLHGNCCDRWFDKSFNFVVCKNGRIGFNGEHSWADAPIMAHLWECTLADDITAGYTPDGHTKGEAEFQPPSPSRLQWEITPACKEVIASSLKVARELASDVDLHLMMHDVYGKGFMKKCKVSPDAYIQMALQLAYFRVANRFCLTYEASMTRLYREGRTETVRSCTIESAAFCRSMVDTSKADQEKIALFKHACNVHQDAYRYAMSGAGIDRHLFCLYVVSKYLNLDSPFLKEVLSEPWRLSTSQTPHQQTDKLDLAKYPNFISAGGGFGPVADDGYGVSYIIAGEDVIFFHISSKHSCPTTSSVKFGAEITRALKDMRSLLEQKS